KLLAGLYWAERLRVHRGLTVSPHRQHRKSAGERIAPISGIANVGAGRLPDGRVAVGHSGAGAGPGEENVGIFELAPTSAGRHSGHRNGRASRNVTDKAVEGRVRSGLAAGGKQIRTAGPPST